jgi:hypothetical protein
MSVVPRKDLEAVQFCENHVAPFTANATAIGTSSATVSDFATKTAAARTAYDAAQAAADAAKNAYLTYHNAVEAMRIAVAGIILQVRAKAETSADMDIYALASLPAPATPSTVGAPGTPEALKVTLKPNGTLEMSWKCSNPTNCTGVIYQIYRKIESTGAYEYLGGTGEKKFTDLTLPSGLTQVLYQVQGTRSTSVGDAADFVVNFGVGGSSTTVTALATPSGKPAAIAA